MSNRRQFLLASAGGYITAATVPLQADAAMGTPPQGLQAHLKSEMRKQMIPAMQVAVVRYGNIVFLQTLGQADIENMVPATNSMVFEIASCTKAFIGVAVMQLAERGKLDLGAGISRYLENLPVPWRAVTVGQLAAHMSGIPDITSNLADLRLLVDGDPEASWQKVKTLPMEFTPGEKFDYVQTNYLLLGKIIEAVTREPFARFVQKHQLDAVGMRRTVWGDDHDVVPHRARTYTPYVLAGGKPKRTSTLYNTYIVFPAMLRTCGGLNTTAEELGRWLIALQRGQLLKRSSLTTLQTARPLIDGKAGPWGVGGWMFQRQKHPVYFSVGAAKSAFAIYPEDDLGVVVLTNLSADLWLPFLDSIASFYVAGIANA